MNLSNQKKFYISSLAFITSMFIIFVLIAVFGLDVSAASESDYPAPSTYSSDYLVRFLYDTYNFDYRTGLCTSGKFNAYKTEHNLQLPSDFNYSYLCSTSEDTIINSLIQYKLPDIQTYYLNGNTDSQSRSISEFNHFALLYYGPNDIRLLLMLSANNSISFGYQGLALGVSANFDSPQFYGKNLNSSSNKKYITQNNYSTFGYFISGNNQYMGSDQFGIDQVCACNFPIYGSAVSTCDFNGNGVIDRNNVISSNGYVLNDYLSFYNNLGSFQAYRLNNDYYSNNSGSGGSGSGSDQGTTDNHLYLPDGDFIFNNTSYSAPYSKVLNTGSVYPNGNITFNFNPDDYQVSNASDYKLQFTFTFDYDVNYKYWSNNSSPPFYKTNQTLNNQKNCNITFQNYKQVGYEFISLSDFINNGNSKTWTFKDIFDNVYWYESLLSYKTLGEVLNLSKEVDSISFNKFNLNCTCYLRSDSDDSKVSNAIEEWYNPMNKKGYTTDSSGQKNNNPYVSNNDDDNNNPDTGVNDTGNNAPGTAGNNGNNSNNVGGGSTSSNATVGNITITNNNNVNGGNGSSNSTNPESNASYTFYNSFNPFSFIINKLVGDNSSSGEELSETLGTNNWITIMSNTFSYMPSAFWVSLATFFISILGIIVVAFILRVVLDLL